MKQRDFNRDMDAYLKERTVERSGGSWWDQLKQMLPKITIESDEPEEKPPEEVPKEHVDKVMRGESVPQPEPEEEFETVVREPFWKRWLSYFVFERETPDSPPSDDVDISELDTKPKGAVDDDVKEMLRICVHWVNMLPPEKIQDIRRSDDYQKFKDLLDRYGLLKKKD